VPRRGTYESERFYLETLEMNDGLFIGLRGNAMRDSRTAFALVTASVSLFLISQIPEEWYSRLGKFYRQRVDGTLMKNANIKGERQIARLSGFGVYFDRGSLFCMVLDLESSLQ
jgi:hypothetical protein